MIDEKLLGAAKNLVKVVKLMDQTVDDNAPKNIAKIIKFNSKGAAVAALSSGWIPGAGGAIAITISAGFIWKMYLNINQEINVPIAKNVLKSLASGVATNLASFALGSLVLSTAFSLFPGLGSAGAAVLIASTCYGLTLASGFVYLKMMTKIFKSGNNPSSYKESELKNVAKDVTNRKEVTRLIKDAKKSYKKEN
jgi:uncharacterized protein (DUF697 family)